MAIDWRRSGLVENPDTYIPQQTPTGGVKSNSSDKQMVGDDNDVPLESFEQCKHAKRDFNNQEHPTVHHKCRYEDMYGRCTRDTCIYDGNETGKIAHKHWDTCVLCGNTLTLSPEMMAIPFCDKCLARLRFAETLPFTCLLCGGSQGRPSKAPFSQICDDCFKNYIYSPNCKHWRQTGTSPAEGYDKL